MKYLESIRLVQFFLFERQDIRLGQISGIFGPNGSGKSSFLDAVQIAMFGGNGRLLALNAQADERHATRSIQAYCLGQYGEGPEARARDSATTYITLIWRDTVTREPVSMGVCMYASGDREGHEVRGRYVIRGIELAMSDHLEIVDGHERPRDWATFRHQLVERSKVTGEEPLYQDSERYMQAALLALRGSGAPPQYEAFTRAFRFALRMRFDKTVDEIVRNDVLESRPTNIRKFKEVSESFRRLRDLVAQVEKKIGDGELVEQDFARAAKAASQDATWNVLACDVALEQANEAFSDARDATFKAEEVLTAIESRLAKAVEAQERATSEAARSRMQREGHRAHADHGALQGEIGQKKAVAEAKLRELKNSLGMARRTLAEAARSPYLKRHVAKIADVTAVLDSSVDRVAGIRREELTGILAPVTKLAGEMAGDLLKAGGEISRELNDEKAALRNAEAALERCGQGKVPLSRKVQELLTELRNRGLDPIPVCDLVRITQLEWQPVIESYLAPHLEALLVAEHEEEPAFNIYRSLTGARAIYGAKIVMESRHRNLHAAEPGSVAELIEGEHPAAVAYLRTQFGDTKRASTNAEALAGRRTLTVDGMLVGRGEIDRLRPTPTGELRIGADTAAQRGELNRQCAQLGLKVKALEELQAATSQVYRTLTLLTGEGVLRSCLESWNSMNISRGEAASLEKRLAGAADQEYVLLGQQEARWTRYEKRLGTVVGSMREKRGSARQTLSHCQTKESAADVAAADARSESTRASDHPEYDREFAARQWDTLMKEYEGAYSDMAAECHRRQTDANSASIRAANTGSGRLGTFLSTYRDHIERETLEDWRKARAWLAELLKRLGDTELRDHKDRMEEAYKTSQDTFRNDVAIALSNNLDWLDETMERLNAVLRSCPAFTNGERYQFRRVQRPHFQALLKFVKDVGTLGPSDDLLGGPGTIPEQFRELLEDKLAPGAAGVRSPLDDYREFFEFDIEIRREDPLTRTTKVVGHLSKRLGPGSGGEHRAPLYVIAGAALASAYRLDRGNKDGISLILLDEAFNKMDPTNIVATMRYFEDLGLQVFMASPGENEGILTAFLHRYFDILRDPERNVVLVEGHDVTEAARAMFREDLPEFHPELVEEELRRTAREAEVAAPLPTSS